MKKIIIQKPNPRKARLKQEKLDRELALISKAETRAIVKQEESDKCKDIGITTFIDEIGRTRAITKHST